MKWPGHTPQPDCCQHAPRVQMLRIAGLAFNFSATPSHRRPSGYSVLTETELLALGKLCSLRAAANAC